MTDHRKVRLLVVGDCMLDRYWHGAVTRISPEAPVAVLSMGTESERLGGAANVALNARSLGANVSLCGVLGKDDGGRHLQKMVSEYGIDNHLLISDDAATVVKLRLLSQGQQLIRVDFERPVCDQDAVEIAARFRLLVGEHDCVVFSDYKKGSLSNVAAMIGEANRRNIKVIVDPKGANYEAYSGANVITPNRAELMQVVGPWSSEADLERRVFSLCNSLNIESVVLTRSEEGMTLFTLKDGKGSRKHYSAEAREVFDVTGAGDTAIATLAVMMLEGLELPDAVRIANRAASIVVGKSGTSTVSRDELFIEQVRSDVRAIQ